MKLAPLVRGTKLYCRRVVKAGGRAYQPGEEIPYTKMALSWRAITQLYNQRRIVSEHDPYFEELMTVQGIHNNKAFAESWLKGRSGASEHTGFERTEDIAEDTWEEEQTPSQSDDAPRLHHRGGGWYDVLVNGEAVNEEPLQGKDYAELFLEDYIDG